MDTVARTTPGAQGLRDLCIEEARRHERDRREQTAQAERERREREHAALRFAVARATNFAPASIRNATGGLPALAEVDGLLFGLNGEGKQLFVYDRCVDCSELFALGPPIATRLEIGRLLLARTGAPQCPQCRQGRCVDQELPVVTG